MTNARLIVAVAALAALVWAPQAAARPAATPPPAGFIDEEAEDCLELVPERHSVHGVDDAGQEVVLDAHFVLDEVPSEDARAIVEHASKPYEEIGIRVAATYEEVLFEPSGRTAGGVPKIDAQELIDATREHFGGYRPHHADVVFTLTGKELTSGGAFGEATAGMADCIGGIRYPAAAFAVGEANLEWEPHGRPGGVIAGHEIAHLLGAHHHYSNCTEALPSGALRGDFNPCTTMSPLAATASSTFGLLERSYVRYYTATYAKG